MKDSRISTTRLAEICGVSQGTVDRALNGRKGIRKETREKILAAAKEYGYRPNIHARSMAGGRSMLIGMVVFDLHNQYFSELLMQIERCCRARGYAVVSMFSDKNEQQEIECIKELYHMSVDGIVLCSVNCGETYEKFLKSLKIPIITVGNRLENFPYVGIDNTKAMSDAIAYVVEQEYEYLYYVKPKLGEDNISAQQERLNAFLDTCRIENVDYKLLSLQEAMQMEQASGLYTTDFKRRSAFICPTDTYAIRLMDIAKKCGMGIIGFDNISVIEELHLGLDSVAYDVQETANLVTEYIMEAGSRNEENHNCHRRIIAHRIVKRGSV